MLHVILVIKVCRKVHCLGRANQPRRVASTQLAPSVTLRLPPREVLCLCLLRLFSFFNFKLRPFDQNPLSDCTAIFGHSATL